MKKIKKEDEVIMGFVVGVDGLLDRHDDLPLVAEAGGSPGGDARGVDRRIEQTGEDHDDAEDGQHFDNGEGLSFHFAFPFLFGAENPDLKGYFSV